MPRLLDIDPDHYQRHSLHTRQRDWAETNCYVDIWIELLHAMGHEPLAVMPFTLAIDFEDDQWTFFKPPLADLFDLYGLDVQEMAVWRPLTEHIGEQLSQGKHVLVELDSWYLPDTEGSAYGIAHVKSTVAVNAFDADARRMDYFHGQGYYRLENGDFRNIFHLDDPDPSRLPPYVEIVKQRPRPAGNAQELMAISLQLLKRQLRLVPERNPFERFAERFERDLPLLMEGDLDLFHAYSFATFRQFGACYELAASYLAWLASLGERRFEDAREDLAAISSLSKVYQFQLARAMSRRKPLDLAPLQQMAALWSSALARIDEQLRE
jgi:hypothetical protein